MTAEVQEPNALAKALAWVMQRKPVKVFQHYARLGGPLLAAGIAYNSLFALFAGVWIAFSILGLVVSANTVVYRAVLKELANSVPGLFGDSGAISPNMLANIPSTLTITGIIALVTLLFTMLGWLNAVRTAIRSQFELGPLVQPPGIAQILDTLRLIAIGVIMLVSALMSVVTGKVGDSIAGFLGFGDDSLTGHLLVGVSGFVVSAVLDACIFAILFRWVAVVVAPQGSLKLAALGGGVATTALKTFGALFIGNVSNPLLAGFATLIGILLWCNFMAQAVVIIGSWGAMAAHDWPREPPLDIPQEFPNQPGYLDVTALYPAAGIALVAYGPSDDPRPVRRLAVARATLRAFFTPTHRNTARDD